MIKSSIKVTVRTSKKTLQMSRLGVSVNPNALLQPEATTGEATDVNAGKILQMKMQLAQMLQKLRATLKTLY